MEVLARHLRDARARTLLLSEDIDDDPRAFPRIAIVNPLRWELGHVAWFQERWVLRHALGRPPILANGDALYDSSAVAHALRWDLPLPSREATRAYLAEILERTIEALAGAEDERLYFHRLALFHEDMHDEAFAITRQTLGLPAPRVSAPPEPYVDVCEGDASIRGGELSLGAIQGRDPFVFDNEKWAHPIVVEPFAIARVCVTNQEFRAFVDAGGYADQRLWSDEGKRWLSESGAKHPRYWSRDREGAWCARTFERTEPLALRRPVVHVNAFEAEAYAAWAGRRLPSEAEWELAASTFDERPLPWGSEPSESAANTDLARVGPVDVAAFSRGSSADGLRQMIGNVWEWTSSRFLPYPGFAIDPYADYSAPWFATPHRVLRGGSFATPLRLLRTTFRNFYPPHRGDVFAGFRTVALR